MSASMSVLRRIKLAWKEVGAIAFLAIGFPWALYQLYNAWTFGVIAVPRLFRLLPGLRVARLADEPIWFWIGVACAALVSVVCPLLLLTMAFESRSAAQYFRRKAMRPPLDQAIRERFDQR